MTSSSRGQHALFQPVVPLYRVALFNAINDALDGRLTIFADATSAESSLVDGSKELRAAIVPSKTYRLGPLWLVPRSVREAWSGAATTLILSWNVRQIELLPTLLIARLRHTPVLLWGHGIGRTGSRLAAAARVIHARLASVVLTYSPEGRDEVSRLGTNVECVVVRNTTGRPPPTEDDVLRSVSRRVGYVGRVQDRKRLDRLFRAIALLRVEGLELEVEITGQGSAEPSLRALVGALGLDDRVSWHPFADEWEVVRRNLTRLDLVVFPEVAGLGVVDAMAAGRAAVVLDDPSVNPPEWTNVVHLENGLRYGAPTPEALAAVLRHAYETDGLLTRLSEAAIEHYRNNLRLEHAVTAFARAVEVAGRRT